ncbi:rapamycin-insensitive companion of mTOR-like [Corticium candelabrum]|uniref:rapamycin-insensitive companion of mTOR-like n=1 Tax=Corticium candelabrum TaxID=121492 RepID=UPI002E276E9F|nr:rapamycin-insensitive companion of mTOR-like [Corticium candelabrum]
MAATLPRQTKKFRKPLGRARGLGSDFSHVELRGGVAENINLVVVSISAGDEEVNAVRKVAYLNAFVRLLQKSRGSIARYPSFENLLYSLRACLLNQQRSVRGATLRTLRYLVNDSDMVQRLVDVKLDLLIMRSFDSVDARPVERVQAMRFIRKLSVVCPQHVPHSLVVSLVATAEHMSTDEKLTNAALATLSELAIVNPSVVAFSRGIKAILRGTIDCVSNCMGESLLMSILYLLNHPDTRCFIRPDIDLEVIVAPFTDAHYRHTAEGQKDEPKETRWLQILAARTALATMFRSWAGLISFCNPTGWGLKSLVEVLRLPNSVTQRGIMDLLYDIFKLNAPDWTDDFDQALTSTDPCRPRDSWRLEEQWVVEEAKVVLSHLRKGRTNLVTSYIAMLLTTFIQAGLLENLVKVVESRDAFVSVQGTILLGELLHLANTILPPECSSQSHCLPTLISVATSFDKTASERNRATAVVNCLDRLHQRKKISTRPDSLYLQLTMSQSESAELKQSTVGKEPQITHVTLKELEEANIDSMLRESQVLTTKDIGQWNWNIIGTILKSPHISMRRLEETSATKFVKRLCNFYKPSSAAFSKLEQTHANVQKYSAIGCRLMLFLLGGEEGIKFANDIISEITAAIRRVADRSSTREDLLSAGSVSHTLSRDYLLLLGQLTTSTTGMEVLKKNNIFSCLLGVCDVIQRRDLNKLLLTSLDYSHSGLCRVVLSKLLTGIDSAIRLYATSYLRVLLQAHLPQFKDWGIEMLITQLYDTEEPVVNEAMDILDEACDDESYLHTIVLQFPALLHIKDRGSALFTRFLSVNRGYWYLQSLDYITEEMERWHQDYNKRYVVQTEQRLAECLTGYRKTDEGQYIRRSRIQLTRLDVFAPVHFYGQLVQLREGCKLLQKQRHLDNFIETLNNSSMTSSDVLDKKAAIWALGHIGTSHWGVQLLQNQYVIEQLVEVAETSPVLSIRGTAFYALSLIARTKLGSNRLHELGWLCLRHNGEQQWPVTEITPQSASDSDTYSLDRPLSTDATGLPTPYTPVFNEFNHPDLTASRDATSLDWVTLPRRSVARQRHSLGLDLVSPVEKIGAHMPLQKTGSLGAMLDTDHTLVGLKPSSSDQRLNVDEAKPSKHKRNLSYGGNTEPGMRSSSLFTSPKALRHSAATLGVEINAALIYGRKTARPVSMIADAETMSKLYVGASPVLEKSMWSDGTLMRRSSSLTLEGGYIGLTVPSNLDAFYTVESFEFKGSWPCAFPTDANEKFMDHLRVKGSTPNFPIPNYEQDSDDQQDETDGFSVVDQLMLRKELFRLLGNLATAVGSKATQQGLKIFKERFPNLFKDSTVYLDVCEMLAVYHYSLPARRLAHSLFEGITLDPAPPQVLRQRSFSSSETTPLDATKTGSQNDNPYRFIVRRRSSTGDIGAFRAPHSANSDKKPVQHFNQTGENGISRQGSKMKSRGQGGYNLTVEDI